MKITPQKHKTDRIRISIILDEPLDDHESKSIVSFLFVETLIEFDVVDAVGGVYMKCHN